jgi:hypothetical protein
MLKMVRQQMICIIAPGWRSGVDLLQPGNLKTALDSLFRDVEVVQFASIALLPPMTDSKDGLPSLMLELAIEEGIDPRDMLYRLVNHPSGTMWTLYGSYQPDGGPPLESERNHQQLFDTLMRCLSIADGGFVGARDRTVRQIMKERHLLDWTRSEGRNLKRVYGNDRASFALALAQRAFQDPRFEWATEPVPRSYWRGKGASFIAKLAYPLVIFGLWLSLVWLVGAVPRWLTGAWAWLFGEPQPPLQAVTDVVSKASEWVLGVSIRGVGALIALGLLAWFLLVALPALFAPWRRWLDNVRRELERPTETWSSRVTYAVGLLVSVLLAPAIAACALVYTFCPDYLAARIKEWTPDVPGWKLIVIAAVAIIVLLLVGTLLSRIVGALFSWINRRFPDLSEAFFHLHEEDVPRAQQVHRSIEECEALLAKDNKVAHMVSLTDIRNPNGWSAWWIRVSLGIVTLFGRVFFTAGRLGDAPGIHFGHWHIIEGGRRYLFCSNYDGNFGGYLDDFINGATIGTTLAWRWTTLMPRRSAVFDQPEVKEPRSFPPTRFAIFRGVKCEMKFKSYARDSMLPHLYRFEAHNATIDQIDLATALRDALFGERNDKNDDLIMRAIES